MLMLATALVGPTVPVGASTVAGDACNGQNSQSTICRQTRNADSNTKKFIKTVTNILLFAVGIISVIMIIVGGLKYTVSNGDSSQVTSAKNTILYSVVGLIVAILAYAIVGFVVETFM